MKELWTVVKKELQEGENIWINKKSQETTEETTNEGVEFDNNNLPW